MGKYYCDYCDIYLTHDSMNARKAHNTGRNHVSNVRDYFASLGHDTAQSIIDQIVAQHESGGRAMYAAPSMRLGAGFLNPNPMAPAPNMSYPPFPATGAFPPQGAPPAVRPPFPPNASMPPFPPPSGVMPPFAPTGQPGAFRPPVPGSTPPFPPSQSSPFAPQQNSPLPNGTAPAPPTGFTPAPGPPTGGQPGIHPDRLRMMGV